MAPKMALKVAPKNKYLTSSTIPYLPKTKLGSLLITSKLPMVYERRILVLFSKATFSIYYVYMCTCIHVFMNTRLSLFQQDNGCETVCLIRRIFVDSAQVVGLDLAFIYTSLDESLGYKLGTALTQIPSCQTECQ